MRQKRRDALKGSADCKGMSVHAPARQGRRTAVMPTDMTMMSRPSVSATTGSEVDGSDYGDTPSSSRMSGGMGLLPGLNPEEMTSFLSNLHANADQDQNSADDELTSPSESVRRTSSVGGPATFFMTKDGSNVSGTESDVTEDAQPQMKGNTLPGLSSDQMALFMKRHANLITEDDQDNEDGEND